jgi:hypothetical protein
MFSVRSCQGIITGKILQSIQSVKNRHGDWCEMAASVGFRELQCSRCEPLLLEAGSSGTGIVLEPRVSGTSAVGSCYQAPASDD